MAAFPIIIDNWEKNGDDSTKTLITNVVKYYMFLTIPILFGMFMLSADFSSLIGAKYAAGSAVIPWVALASVCTGINIYTDMGLQLKKKTIYISIIMIIAAISNVVMNLALVPGYGYYGSAVSSAFAQIVFLILTWAISWKYLPWQFPRGSFVRCIGASTVMCLALFALKSTIFRHESLISLVVLVSAGFLLYMAIIVATGELREELGFAKKYFLTQLQILRMNIGFM